MTGYYLTGLAIDDGGKPSTIATFDQESQRWIFESIALGTHVVLPYVPQTKERLSDELREYHRTCLNVLAKRTDLRRAERAVLRWKSRHAND